MNFNVEKKKSPSAKKTDSIIFKKVLGASQRLIDNARARDTSPQKILTYDLIETSTIFKEDLPTKPDRASLVNESKKNVSSTLHTSIIFDSMTTTRTLTLHDLRGIGDIFLAMLKRIESTESEQDLHLVYDSYLEHCIKNSESV